MGTLTEGTTLKSWILGKKLGSGACSDVYSVKPLSKNSSSIAKEFVMKLSPIPVIANKNKKKKKTPAERNADALYAEHLIYQNFLRGVDGFAELPTGAYGEDKGYRFLVIERLGKTLDDIHKEKGPIPSKTAARLGLEILELFKYLHSKNVIYVDVKPENFMLNMGSENKVYCVDFGISEKFVLATGKHKEFKSGSVIGTPTFLSLNCHAGATPSRRDDIEALLYVLIYLVQGSLPWANASNDNEGAKLKKETSLEDLCGSMEVEWIYMLKNIRSCGFEEKPNYAFFEKNLEKIGGKKGLTDSFDWEKTKSKKKTIETKAKTKSPAKGKQISKRKPTDSSETAAPLQIIPNKETAPIKKASPELVEPLQKKLKITSASRSTKTSPSSNKSKSPAKAKAKEDNDKDEEQVEFVMSVTQDPRRRRKAAAKAIAAAAAATAAAKQAKKSSYRLRSSK